MTRFICTVPLILLISACASHTPVPTCPAIVPYTEAQQNQAADELDQLGPQSMLSKFISDYGELRARLRACP